jgi:hypothetical protein
MCMICCVYVDMNKAFGKKEVKRGKKGKKDKEKERKSGDPLIRKRKIKQK